MQSAECERLTQALGGGESALRVCAALLGAGPQASPMHPHHLPGNLMILFCFICSYYIEIKTTLFSNHNDSTYTVWCNRLVSTS